MSSGPESSLPTRNKKQPDRFLRFVTFPLEQELFHFAEYVIRITILATIGIGGCAALMKHERSLPATSGQQS
jgi:hypothetical protein